MYYSCEKRSRWTNLVLEMLLLLLAALDEGADLACGSRHVVGSRIAVSQGALRVWMGSLFRRLVRLIADLPVRDTQCGCKAFQREKFLPIFDQLQEEGFAFDIEILLEARRQGFVIAEVPIVWSDAKKSTVRPIRDGIQMFRALIRRVRHDRTARNR